MAVGNAINGKIFTYISPTIDFKATGLTTIFTTLPTVRFVPMQYTMYVESQMSAVGDSAFNMGWTAADYDDFQLGVSFVSGSNATFSNSTIFSGSLPTFPPSTVIRANVTMVDSGSVLTGKLIINGYYL